MSRTDRQPEQTPTGATGGQAEALREEITDTREQLRDTLDAISVELSPKVRAQRAAERTRSAIAERPAVASVLAAALVAVLVAVPVWRRSR